jgi:hypothetical protein
MMSAAAAAVVLWSAASMLGDDGRQEPVTLTGCLRTGSAATVYILRGATAPAVEAPDADGQEMPRDYLLVAIPGNVDVAGNVNKRVAITGPVSRDAGPVPEGANAAERALRRLSVQGLRVVADSCGQ